MSALNEWRHPLPNITPNVPEIFNIYNLAKLLTQFPALTLMVFTRRRLGLRRCEPVHVFIMAALLAVTGWGTLVFPFAVGVAWFGYAQHRRRWREMRLGALWHTYSDGVSICTDALVKVTRQVREGRSARGGEPEKRLSLAWVRWRVLRLFDATPESELPALWSADWWAEDCRVQRYVEFLVFAPLGALLVIGSAVVWRVTGSSVLYVMVTPLGMWLVAAACCVRVYEDVLWRMRVTKMLDFYDEVVNAGTFKEARKEAKAASVVPRQSRPRHLLTPEATRGVPAGIGVDITNALARTVEREWKQAEKEEQDSQREAEEAAKQQSEKDAQEAQAREAARQSEIARRAQEFLQEKYGDREPAQAVVVGRSDAPLPGEIAPVVMEPEPTDTQSNV